MRVENYLRMTIIPLSTGSCVRPTESASNNSERVSESGGVSERVLISWVKCSKVFLADRSISRR